MAGTTDISLTWRCPACNYPLHGLTHTTCPECGRVSSEAEQRELARRRQMPRNLPRIARFGMVFTLVVGGWSLVGLLVTFRNGGPRNTNAPGLPQFTGALVLCALALPACIWVQMNLRRIHARSEPWSWIAAHATWFGAIGAVALLRWI
jgi:hypothetical protein